MTRHDQQRLRVFNRQARKRKTIRTGRRVAMAVAPRGGGLVARVRRSMPRIGAIEIEIARVRLTSDDWKSR